MALTLNFLFEKGSESIFNCKIWNILFKFSKKAIFEGQRVVYKVVYITVFEAGFERNLGG